MSALYSYGIAASPQVLLPIPLLAMTSLYAVVGVFTTNNGIADSETSQLLQSSRNP